MEFNLPNRSPCNLAQKCLIIFWNLAFRKEHQENDLELKSTSLFYWFRLVKTKDFKALNVFQLIKRNYPEI